MIIPSVQIGYDPTQFSLVDGKLHLDNFLLEATDRTCVGVDTANGSGSYGTSIGYKAGSVSSGTSNTLVGAHCGELLTTGVANCIMGMWSLRETLSGSYNSGCGYYILVNCQGNANTVAGAFAASLLTTGFEDVAIGYYALEKIKQGFYNMALGSTALRNCAPTQRTITGFSDLGGGQTQVTTSAAHGLTTADYVYISGTTNYNGWYTLVSGSGTTFVITKAFVADDAIGYVHKDTEANYNVAVGAGAGRDIGTGAKNVLLGYGAGRLASNIVGCIYIGCDCGSTLTTSNVLAIHNSNSATPLIHGNFATSTLTINGTLTATGLTTAPNFVSNVAIGTSPYACTSTTVNTNLNADLLDGNHASAFVTAVTGTSPITSSGGTTPAIGITQTLITNLNSVLSTGLLKIATGTGLLSTAVAGTDYQSGSLTAGTIPVATGSPATLQDAGGLTYDGYTFFVTDVAEEGANLQQWRNASIVIKSYTDINGTFISGDTNTDVEGPTVGFGMWRNAAVAFIGISYSNTASTAPGILYRRTRGTQASKSAVQADDRLGYFYGSGRSTNDTFVNSCGISFYCDGAPGAGTMPGRVAFLTGTGGADGTTRFERLVIKNDGEVRHYYAATANYGSLVIDSSGYWQITATGGVKICTATSQLLGFYGAAPVNRPDTVADPTGGATVDTECRAAVAALIDRLQELGLVA